MWLILATLGCGSDAREFAFARAAAICAWHARCDTLAAAGFVDEAGCIRALEEAAADQDRAGELGCSELDAAAAESCLAVWEEGSCDTPLDLSPCDAVCGP